MLFRDRDRALRSSHPLARAWGFAAAAVPVSLVGHLAAGGNAPNEATFLLALVLTALGYRTVLAGWERSWPVLTTALAVAEAALHLLFMSGGSVVEDTGAGLPPARGMQGTSMTPGQAPTGHGDVLGGLASSVGAAGWGMVLAHLLAAVVLGWFLRQGERALWTAARRLVHLAAHASVLLRAALGRPVGPDVITVRPRLRAARRPRWHAGARRRRFLATGGRFWRGPPADVACTS